MSTAPCQLPLRDCRAAPPLRTCTRCGTTLCHGCAVNQRRCIHCGDWICGQIECKEPFVKTYVSYCCPPCRTAFPGGKRCSLCTETVECGGCAETCERHNVVYCGGYACTGYVHYTMTGTWECPKCAVLREKATE